jgi:hypothetical protein
MAYNTTLSPTSLVEFAVFAVESSLYICYTVTAARYICIFYNLMKFLCALTVCASQIQDSALTDSSSTIALSDQHQQQQQQQQWGGSCLQIAFNSLKLVVDDFLDRVPPIAIPLLVSTYDHRKVAI